MTWLEIDLILCAAAARRIGSESRLKVASGWPESLCEQL
jgi:hypothetical protein